MFLIRVKDDTESTETPVLKSQLATDVPVLASPDLLSEVSEMKQDLMKMTALLTADAPGRAGPLRGRAPAGAAEEEPGEPFEIVERVKEDLEKVNEILRGGPCSEGEGHGPGARPGGELGDEEWVLLSDEDIAEARQRAPLEAPEVPCVEVRLERETPAQGQKDATGLVNYLTEDLNSYTAAPEDPRPVPRGAGDRRSGSPGKDAPRDETQSAQKQHAPGLGVRKPVRRKLKEKLKQKEEGSQAAAGKTELKKGSSEESLEEGPGSAPEPLPMGQATSPLVEETPIGPIRDKVQALQQRVEEERKGQSKLPVRVKGKEEAPRRVSSRPPAAAPPLRSDRRAPAPPSSKADRHASLASAKSDRHPPASPPSKTERHSPVSPSTKPDRHSPVSPSTKPDRHSPVSPSTKPDRHSPVSPSTKTERQSPVSSSGKTEKHSPVSPSSKTDRRPPVSPSGRTEKHPPVSPGKTDKRLPASPAARMEKHPPGLASGKTERRLSVSPSGKTEKAAPVSPTSKTERISETMSVRELMKAFQSGQDPSKHKAGLFEHKAAKPKQLQERGKVRAEAEKGQIPAQKETQKTQSQGIKRGQRFLGAAAAEPRGGPLGASGRRGDAVGGKEPDPNHRALPPVGPAPGEEPDPSHRALPPVGPAPGEEPDGRGDGSLQISPDRRASTDFSEAIRQELEDNDQYQRFRHREAPQPEEARLVLEQVLTSPFRRAFPPEPGELLPSPPARLDGSCESLRQDGLAASPCGSLMEGTPQVSSEESYKHEGLAETPETSPESLSSSPKRSQDHTGDTSDMTTSGTDVHSGKECPPAEDTPDGAQGPGAAVAEGSEPGAGCVKATPDPSGETGPKLERDGLGHGAVSSAEAAPAGLTTDVPCDAGPPAPKTQALPGPQGPTSPRPSPPDLPVRTGQSQAAPRSPPALALALPRPDTEVLSPGADESLAVSHRDSLEASPVLEDNSSHKTPDSLEPSPLRESPCRDSLESSPVEPKTQAGILPGRFPLPTAVAKAELLAEAASVRSRLLRDPDGSTEDDSLEQTSLVESSGKSPLSPDTPSSEEISYEVTPKASEAGAPKPAVIQECAEEDDSESGEKRRFTPEEEMFKMVAKIKTFEELEQEARQKRDGRREPRPEECASSPEPGTEGPADAAGAPRGRPAEDEGDVPVVPADGRTASSSESEPELRQLAAGADPDLLPEPVIRVQPPSPRLSSLDSNSSPEEVQLQPAASKRYTFRMNGDAQEEPGKSGERGAGPHVPEDSCGGPAGGPGAAPDDVSRGAGQTQFCAGHGCAAGSPQSLDPCGPPSADASEGLVTSEGPAALWAPGERDSGEELHVSPVASPHTDGPSGGSSYLSPAPECPASEGKGSDGAVISTSSPTDGATETDHASESSPKGSPALGSSITTQMRRPSVDVPGPDPPETEGVHDLQVISPYENVPPQSFFSSKESKAQTDAGHGSSHSSDACAVTGTSSVGGGEGACSSRGTVSSKELSFESQEVEPTQDSALWGVRTDGAPASPRPAPPSCSAGAGERVSQVVITTAEAGPGSWSEIREDDAAFEARVKEEEQKVFGLMADRRSQGTTPDTTPARTPTEEGTPTSEQNPFLFQEGKLFEMTRSGAIDMTKRSYADESFHFFQIGQESGEETISEAVTGGGAAAEASGPETPAQTLAHSEPKDAGEANVLPDDLSEEGGGTPASEGHLCSQAGLPASVDMAGAEAASVGTEDLPPTHRGTVPPASSVRQTASPPSPEPAVQVQLDFCSVTRSVYSDQDDNSPGSTPEEQKSVIEIPTALSESAPPSESKSEAQVRTRTPATPAPAPEEERLLPSPDEDRREQEMKPKSKIPVKTPLQGAGQQPLHMDSSLQKTGAPRGQDVPGRAAGDRSKSESDASPLDSKTRCAAKPRSCAEPEAENGEGAEELPLESEQAAARPKPFASRLPVKSRGGPSSCRGPPSPTRESREHFFDLYRDSIEFFEEISDEASKLVDRLTQSEREQEAASDDESSSALEVSVIENLPPVETEHSVPEDIFDTRPIWDESIETLIERIPDENGLGRAEGQQDAQARMEERLAYIADHLGFSWTELARELDFTEEQIHQIRVENPNSLQDQSHALLKYWLERDGKLATDTSLIECLTKVNRMDIVHLMETSTEPLLERASHSYTEIEQTITLDHSEGFSVLQDELPTRHQPAHEPVASREGESCSHPPIVSDEDLSVGYYTFQDYTSRTDRDIRGLAGTAATPKEPAPEPQQQCSVTTPRTEGPDTEEAAAAPGSPSRAPEEGRSHLQAPSPEERADMPLVQEPKEPPELREAGSPRKNSLVIVESSDEQPLAFENLGEDSAFQKELTAELGGLEASSDDEAMVTTRVVRRRVIIQGDDVPDMPPETVTEEQYVDEQGHTVVKKVTRKVIRRYVSPDGVEREEVTLQGQPQEPVSIEDGDGYSKVIKRVVLKSDTEQSEVTLSESGAPCEASRFQAEPVEGRRVSRVIKTTVVHGERKEKRLGDPRFAADLPSAKEDFEQDDTQ